MLHGSGASRILVWSVGVAIYLMICGACFTGYSLVYGQMSLWAMVVICSLVTAVPVVGTQILELLWGGSVVSGATVNRFFGIHFILPLVLVVLVLVHVGALHMVNSSGESTMVLSAGDRISFYPLLLGRDVAIVSAPAMVLGWYAFFDQDAFGHPDNYCYSNALVTPALIAPEWYFLPFYAIIRAIPHKVLGIVIMAAIVVSLFGFGTGGVRMHQGMLGGSSLMDCTMRMSISIFILEMCIGSVICLAVNHAESMYLLLCASMIGVCCSELVINCVSDGSLEPSDASSYYGCSLAFSLSFWSCFCLGLGISVFHSWMFHLLVGYHLSAAGVTKPT